MVSIRRLLQLFPQPLSITRFSPGLLVVLQEIVYQPSFPFIRLLQEIMHFKSKTIFFFQLVAGWFWFCCFLCICFLVGAFSQSGHHETTSSFIFAFMYSFLFDLSQITNHVV